MNNKQTDQTTNMGGGDAGAGPRLSAPPKTQVYGAPPGAATLGFAGHSAQVHYTLFLLLRPVTSFVASN